MKKIAFVVLAILLFPVSFVFGQEEKSKRTIPIECNHVISVSIINKAGLNEDTLSLVKNAIDSKYNYTKDGHTYFKGWNALLNDTGSGASLEVSSKSLSNADITIVLRTEKNPEYDGLTTPYYVSGHVASATVIIYDANHIPNNALENLVRHEMGHALGLKHSETVTSIMYPLLDYTPKFISDADLDELKSNYEGLIYNSNRCL